MQKTILLSEVNAALKKPVNEALLQICKLLENRVEHYTWVGFYFMNHNTRQLHLGPYVGAPTDHMVIPFGKGICGQVAISGKTYLADNVEEESNYIACSVDVRSEIVVPVYIGKELVAQLDIDSHKLHAFSSADEELLNEICLTIAKHFGRELRFNNFFGAPH
ncbi:MAG: GAF domain-containing protein [Owenweeksia sp.]